MPGTDKLNDGLWPQSGLPPILHSLQGRNGFYIFQWLKKISKEEDFFYTWKLLEIQTLVSTNKVLLEPGVPIIHIFSATAFTLQWQS